MPPLRFTTTAQRKSNGVAMPLNQPRDSFSGDGARDKGKRVIRIAYDTSSTSWISHVPATGTAHPVAPWMLFQNYTLQQIPGHASLADLVLNYEQEDFESGGGLPDLPEPFPDENGSILEIDIVRHPDFELAQWGGLSMKDFYNPREQRIFMSSEVPEKFIDQDGETKSNPNAGETVPLAIRGMDKYVVGTGTVTLAEYSYNEPAHVIPDSGKRSVPTGYPGTVANWLVVSGIRRKDGAWWVRELVYQYSEKPIPGEVYEDL